ncbi:MAG: hydrogenase nickel incorporation protein HypB [Erysipelotrichaceae bacterium]|nr:hydrogenase nickel incorporation protein HypB [Erysipelotrichaceae bacterium]
MRDKFEILETKVNLIDDNDRIAAQVREYVKEKNVYFINLMGCPGAGKTSFLCHLIERLKDDYRIGVIEADADGDVDARTVSDLGVKALQVHTGGSCHMDATMTFEALKKLDLSDLDLVVLENVGNLVCPAEFDVGSNLKVMILSVTEGDDKPLKYPLMFTISDVLIINKTDAMEVFDFDPKRLRENVAPLNGHIEIIPVSCKTGKGIEDAVECIRNKVEASR